MSITFDKENGAFWDTRLFEGKILNGGNLALKFRRSIAYFNQIFHINYENYAKLDLYIDRNY